MVLTIFLFEWKDFSFMLIVKEKRFHPDER